MKSNAKPNGTGKIKLTRKTLVKLAGSEPSTAEPQFARPCTPACSYTTGGF